MIVAKIEAWELRDRVVRLWNRQVSNLKDCVDAELAGSLKGELVESRPEGYMNKEELAGYLGIEGVLDLTVGDIDKALRSVPRPTLESNSGFYPNGSDGMETCYLASMVRDYLMRPSDDWLETDRFFVEEEIPARSRAGLLQRGLNAHPHCE